MLALLPSRRTSLTYCKGNCSSHGSHPHALSPDGVHFADLFQSSKLSIYESGNPTKPLKDLDCPNCIFRPALSSGAALAAAVSDGVF